MTTKFSLFFSTTTFPLYYFISGCIKDLRRKSSKDTQGDVELNEWKCVQVGHHENVGETIEEWQKNGWSLHTYTVAQLRGSEINHYLLFEKGE